MAGLTRGQSDGADRGRGGVRLPLFASKHDVRVDVRPARMAHVKF